MGNYKHRHRETYRGVPIDIKAASSKDLQSRGHGFDPRMLHHLKSLDFSTIKASFYTLFLCMNFPRFSSFFPFEREISRETFM